MKHKKIEPVGDLKLDLRLINRTKDAQFGEDSWTITGEKAREFNSIGEVFEMLRDEWGKCVSKVYQDRKNAPPAQLGWVFQSIQSYEDARPGDREQKYLREVWVSFYRDARCGCCEHVCGRWAVTIEEARKLLARKEALAA